MNDRFQFRARRRIGEHDIGQRGPVEIRPAYDRRPALGDCGETLRPRSDDLACKVVGIDDARSESGEDAGGRALARAEAAG
jgi:hypothetical protein